MGSFPFADTSHSIPMWHHDGPTACRSDAQSDAGWWRPGLPPSAGCSAPALLPLDDHHDITIDSKCTRRGFGLAGARAVAFALRLP
jgi:hypothetical protein